jgi:hypothetical protein
MSNYAVGYVMTAAFRDRILEVRGSWVERDDPGWYPWLREHLLRFGLERRSGDVVRDLLGGPPTPDALVAEIARAAT